MRATSEICVFIHVDGKAEEEKAFDVAHILKTKGFDAKVTGDSSFPRIIFFFDARDRRITGPDGLQAELEAVPHVKHVLILPAFSPD